MQTSRQKNIGCNSFRRSLVSRREMIQLGGASMLGLGLPDMLAAQPTSSGSGILPRADRCIIIFLNGGPSHLDMWDMKPEGPTDSKGQFKPIASSLSGVQFCEHLPRLAGQMHRGTLVRSMHHTVNNSHAAAVYVSMTGHDRGEMGGGFKPTDNPTPGAVLTHLRPPPADVVPHACLPYDTKEGAKGPPQPGFRAGWLGRTFDPLWILKDPNSADFSVPEFHLRDGMNNTRVTRRSGLLTELNQGLPAENGHAPLKAMSGFQQRALDILTSTRVQQAFKVDQEPAMVRDSYGRNIYGQSVLLARRLLEAGTRLVTVSWAPDANATWDTHSSNFNKLKNTLLPQLDMAAGSLLEDLAERSMLKRTLVAILGDFGRTPKINNNSAGRDHWNFCYSVMLAGGGIREGHVHGASDPAGAYPADNPTTPADILATMYRLLGVNHRQQLYDRFQRPHQLVSRGSVIPGLLS